LSAFGFFQGCSLGDLIAYAAYVDPRIISTAFLATATVFACFTASALLARRQSYLALGGLLSSGVSWLLLIGLLNMFFRSKLAFSAVLYLGLLIFCGYVLYDTRTYLPPFSLINLCWQCVPRDRVDSVRFLLLCYRGDHGKVSPR